MGFERVHMAALAGLLHDVGKFAQRAGEPPDEDYQAFNEKDYGAHGAHAKWSATFVSRHVPAQWRAGLSPVLYHHEPRDAVAKAVALADRLSAAERERAEQGRERQLLSVFCRLGEPDRQPAEKFWPLRRMALSEDALFPSDALPPQQEAAAYRALWEQFVADVERLPDDDLPSYLEGLYYALQRHTWCVPGAYYRSLPDVSLFDHSRTTAALAACLVELDEPTLDALLTGERQEEPLVLLVGGDVSGVQDFIYTLTAKGAAKGLRGRSFYLQLLTEAVARYVLRRLDLPLTNLLYVGGGHLYLLAPFTDATVEALRTIQAEVSHKLLDHHQGDLYLALGWDKVTAQDFKREAFGEKWQAVSREMNAAKRRRFAELDAETLREQVFAPQGSGGGKEHECQVCHYYGQDVQTEGQGEAARRICPLCRSLEDLGGALRDADYVLLGQVPPQDGPRAGFTEALAAFGLAPGLTAQDGRPVWRVLGRPARLSMLAMRDRPDVFDTAERVAAKLGCPVAAGTRYTVNVTPRTPDGDIATFDWLQKQSQGVQRLGVLRMDVDDLGDLFRWGMAENATLSRVAALNLALTLFFEGWVGQLCRRVNAEAGSDRVYAIYSGGDDLFIVGAWDVLPGLAHAIHADLGRLAAGHPDVHLSGGLTLHGGKYPLYQAAADAERALDAAKDLERAGKDTDHPHNKDAFHFLDVTLPWETYPAIAAEQKVLCELTRDREAGGAGVSRALLQTLLTLYTRYRDHLQEDKLHWGPWMWRGAYNLTRLAEQHKKQPAVQAQIETLRDELKQEDYRHIEIVGPAARWAELLTRKERKA